MNFHVHIKEMCIYIFVFKVHGNKITCPTPCISVFSHPSAPSFFLRKYLLVWFCFSITFSPVSHYLKALVCFFLLIMPLFSAVPSVLETNACLVLSPPHTHTHTRLSSSFDCCPLGLALQQERCSTLPSHSLSSLLFSSLSCQIRGDLIVLLCLKYP